MKSDWSTLGHYWNSDELLLFLIKWYSDLWDCVGQKQVNFLEVTAEFFCKQNTFFNHMGFYKLFNCRKQEFVVWKLGYRSVQLKTHQIQVRVAKNDLHTWKFSLVSRGTFNKRHLLKKKNTTKNQNQNEQIRPFPEGIMILSVGEKAEEVILGKKVQIHICEMLNLDRLFTRCS